jgi:uncharacterized RDD family membrane protein YckC
MENAAVEGEFQGVSEVASRGLRLAAYLLDGLIVLPLMVPTVVLGYRFRRILAAQEAVPGTLVFAAVLCLVSLLVFAGYQYYLEAAKGQSLGKRWTGIKIVGPDGKAPGFLRGLVLRRGMLAAFNLFLLLTFGKPIGQALGYLVVLADLLVIFAPGSRCIHDRLADTRVVRAATQPAAQA